MKEVRRLLTLGLIGLGISLCGALPFGVLNITAIQIGIEEGHVKALFFAFGVVFMEMIYIFLTLYGVNWIRKYQRFFTYIERLAVVIFLVASGISFYAVCYPLSAAKPHVARADYYFLKGVFMSAVNPAQFPFWIGWNTVLFSKGLLKPGEKYYVIYAMGAGTGTLIALTVFIVTGHILQEKFMLRQQYVHAFTGIVFLISAVLQQCRIQKQKFPTRSAC